MLCECGCEGDAGSNRFIKYHHLRRDGQPRGSFPKREGHFMWKGGRHTSGGYVYILKPEHPRANTRGYVREHVMIAEAALGKPLPAQAVVHHIDTNPSNNKNTNLVICEDQAYHRLLHQRTDAMRACGNPDWRACLFCGRYEDPATMAIRRRMRKNVELLYYHKACNAVAQRAFHRANPGKQADYRKKQKEGGSQDGNRTT